MNKIFLTKEVCIIILYSIVLIPIIVVTIINIIKAKEKGIRFKYFYIMYFIIFLFSMFIPHEEMMDMIPIKRNNIEDAFNFDFNYDYKLAFKKRYKNTYFTMGKSTYNYGMFDKFGFYKNTKYGWRTLIQPSDDYTGVKSDFGYNIHYYNNKIDKVTGIFITVTGAMDNGFGKNIKIKDKYNTKFDYIKYKNGKPIIHQNFQNYIYFGIVKHNIDENYYIKIDNSKVKFD